jgi:putative endonuclease
MYTVYILYSSLYNKIYIGYTNNLEARFLSHNELGKKGWTIKYRPWIVVYSEEYQTKAEALLREKELKSSPLRKWIWEEIVNKCTKR